MSPKVPLERYYLDCKRERGYAFNRWLDSPSKLVEFSPRVEFMRLFYLFPAQKLNNHISEWWLVDQLLLPQQSPGIIHVTLTGKHWLVI